MCQRTPLATPGQVLWRTQNPKFILQKWVTGWALFSKIPNMVGNGGGSKIENPKYHIFTYENPKFWTLKSQIPNNITRRRPEIPNLWVKYRQKSQIMDVRRQNPKSQITISGPQNPKSQMKTPPVTHFSGTSKSQIPTEKVGNGGPPACPGVGVGVLKAC